MQPSLDYRLQQTLSGHTGPINCLEFSQDGLFLASGADDGYIIIWSLTLGDKFLHKISPKQGPITTLRWLDYAHISQSLFLVSGGADGTIKLWRKSPKEAFFNFAGMRTALDTPIEQLVIEGSQLAVVGRNRLLIFIIDITSTEPFEMIISEPSPGRLPICALARTVHFFNGGLSVMVGFLDTKEIIAWSVKPWNNLWRHKLATRIGNTAWSNSSQTLLVWNLLDGIDIYRITDTLVCVGKLSLKIRKNFPVQIAIGAQGKAITGSDSGEVYIWDIERRERTHVLSHGKGVMAVQAVTYHSPRHNQHYIAGGSSDTGEKSPTIKIWSNCTTRRDQPRDSHILSITLAVLLLSVIVIVPYWHHYWHHVTVLAQYLKTTAASHVF